MGCIYYHILAVCCLFFFFSSRRRHTRLQGDWSSDVCSSDLMRGLANDDESIGNAKKIGTHVITAETIHLEGIGKVLSQDRKSTRLNSSHLVISYAVFCLKKKKNINQLSITLHLAVHVSKTAE